MISVNINGRNKLSPEFLKNSTSSNKFKIKPKQKEIKITLKNFKITYPIK